MARRLLLVILIVAAATLKLQAIDVTTTAGNLAKVVTDHNVTSLSINGTIDARDFQFIADDLLSLKTLNLASATIVEFRSNLNDNLLTGVHHYKDNEMPYCALAGHITLENLTLPANLTSIGYGAMAGCSKLKSIIFPASLVWIDDDAFNSCTSLTTVTIDKKIKHLGAKAFAHCSNLTTVVIKPNEKLEIGDEAFANCTKLANVSLSFTITKIGDGAFSGCSALKKLNMNTGSWLEDIGNQAFYNSGLEEINLDKTPRLNHLGAWALARTKLSKMNVPAHVKKLDEGVLFYNTKLTSIELPKTLTYLPNYMLAGCDKIKGTTFMTLKMGNIGDYALYNQSQHASINVPMGVYYIGSHAMAGMTGLTEINSEPIEAPALGDNVWEGVDQSAVTLNVNKESVNLYKAAPQWMDFLVTQAQLRGDVDDDGFVTSNDAAAERRYLVDGTSQGIITDRTDVNGDGMLNVADIVSIYNIINGSEPTEQPRRKWFIDNVEGNGKASTLKTAKVEILLENIVTYTAFGFKISTPSHISITNATLSGRCVGHEIYLKQEGAGHYSIVSFSPALDDIDGNSGTLLTLDITSSNVINANDKITLDEITFVDHQEHSYMRNDVSINVLGISAVDTITIDDSDTPVNVYNTQGQLLRMGVKSSQATQGLPAGIYIVGGKKVIVR